MVKRKRYDKEFRLRAARLVVEQGYSQSERVTFGFTRVTVHGLS